MNKHPLSESAAVGCLLAFMGGYLDVYTYFTRGGVFAYAQTGNLIFLGLKLAEGLWLEALTYLLPIGLFAVGVFLAEVIRVHIKIHRHIRWQQAVLAIEALTLAGVAFIPQKYNILVSGAVAFVSAMQMESFRNIGGNAIATTMCTGNLRTATELFFHYTQGKNPNHLYQSLSIYGIVAVFTMGAVAGMLCTRVFGEKSILLCSLGLIGVFVLLFGEEHQGA